ncbi:MAG: TonB-dependent receptor [Proteobacteria bacterium]|nr:TonB-dependent receptor [Pseudomonadota bacterium]
MLINPVSGGLLGSALVLLCFASSDSVAAPASNLAIEEIIVTAQKRQESVQKVPIAITALTEELRDATVRNLTDVNGYAPNVNIAAHPGRTRGSAIQIRGISYSETDKSFDSPIAVVLDGIFMGTSSGQIIENFDVDRIEILRGPQGTLFGKNTVGGVINIIRSRPTGELGGKLQITGGEWGQQEIRGVLNVPTLGEMLSTKLFYTNIQSDGHMKNTFIGGDGPEKDYVNYGAAFLLEVGENFDAVLTVERYEDDSDLGANTNENYPGEHVLCDGVYSSGYVNPDGASCFDDPGNGEGEFSTNQMNVASFDQDAVTLEMNFDINDNLRLVSVTGWRDDLEDYIQELDGSSLPHIWIDNDNTHEQLSTELRLEGSYDRFNFSTGIYLWRAEYAQDWVTFGDFWQSLVPGFANNAPVAPGLGLTDLCLLELVGTLRCDQAVGLGSAGLGDNFVQKLHQDQEVESEAVYFQGDWLINDQWTLTAGLRWTKETKDFVGNQSYLAPVSRAYIDNYVNFAGQPDVADLSEEWTELSPKAGVSYAMTDDIMFYLSYSEGFHSGGFFGRNQDTKDFNNTYDPEYANSWEAGMKAQFFENRVQLNVTAFHNDFQDKQEASIKQDPSTLTVVTVIDNVGSATYMGLEAELRWVVSANFNMFATAGLLDAEYDEFFTDIDGAIGGFNPADYSHLTPRFAPDSTFGIGGTYSLPIGPGSLDLHARYYYIDDQEGALDNNPRGSVDAQNRVSASLSYGWDKYRLTVFGRNLTDDIVTGAVDIGGLFGLGSEQPGRSWGIEFYAQFGD